MMDWQRIVLILGMAIIGVMLLIRWNDFQEARQPTLANNTTTTSVVSPSQTDTPQIPDTPITPDDSLEASDEIHTPTRTAPVISEPKQQGSKLVSVKTDTLDILIDTYGGDIVKASLVKYPTKIDRPNDPLVLLNRNESTINVAKSGLMGTNGTNLKNTQSPT